MMHVLCTSQFKSTLIRTAMPALKRRLKNDVFTFTRLIYAKFQRTILFFNLKDFVSLFGVGTSELSANKKYYYPVS